MQGKWNSILTIGSELREGPSFDDFVNAVKWANDYVERNKGTKVQVQARVTSIPGLLDHAYTLYEVGFPAIEKRHREEIIKKHGDCPT